MFANILSWLRRLPTVRTKPFSRRPRPPLYRLDIERFEERFYPNDPLGLAQASLFGSGLVLLGTGLTGATSAEERSLHGGLARAFRSVGRVRDGLPATDAVGFWHAGEVPLALVPPSRPAAGEASDQAKFRPYTATTAPFSGHGPGWLTAEDLFRDPLASEWPGALTSAAARGQGKLPTPPPESGSGNGSGTGNPGGSTGGYGGGQVTPPGTGTPPTPQSPAGSGTGQPPDPAGLGSFLPDRPVGPQGHGQPGKDDPEPPDEPFTPGIVAFSSSAPLGTGSAATVTPSRRFLDRNHGRQLLLGFEPNVGQVANGQVQFLARGAGYTTYLSATETALVLTKPLRPAGAPATAAATQRAVLRFQLVGANPAAKAVGVDELPTRSNYFIGNDPRNWRSAVPNYAQVSFRNIYNGIDLRYYGNQRQVEYDFVVAPGANPSQIRLAVQGADSLTLSAQGHLVLSTAGGDVTHRAPVLYQLTSGGARQAVAGNYVLLSAGQVGIQVGAYDPSRPLYIDPVLDYSAYLGGSGDDFGVGLAVDSQGNAYVTGQTDSPNLPPGGTLQGTTDAFVAKLDTRGNRVWVTYLGGSTDTGVGMPPSVVYEAGISIAVDVAGNTYVTGRTNATDFPATPGSFQPGPSGGLDAFVAKLNAAGALSYATYLGGTNDDLGTAIAVDPDGVVYVTGQTFSDAPSFFVTPNALQPARAGSSDAFLVKLNAVAGVPPLYSSFLGGTGFDAGLSIAVDAAGNAYVAGQTFSGNFPLQPNPNPIQPLGYRGGGDAFVAKVNTAAPLLVYSTFLGGTLADQAAGIALDPSGNAYVVGWTDSIDFNTTQGSYKWQRTPGDTSREAFVAKINANGTSLGYSTYLGADSAADAGAGIAVDAAGTAHVTGYTESGEFPVVLPVAGYGGGRDAFVSRLSAAGDGLLFSTHLGGSGSDQGRGVGVDAAGNIYVTGYTASLNFPGAGQFQGGTYDAFVAKIGRLPAPPVFTSISPDTGVSTTDRLTSAQNLTFNGTATPGSTIRVTRQGVGLLSLSPVPVADSSGNWSFSYPVLPQMLAAGTHTFTATAELNGQTSADSAPFQIVVDPTAPTVTLYAPSSTYDLTPQVRVVASDRNGLPNGTTVTLAVDANRDGVFSTGEMNYATGTLQFGQAIFDVPTLTLDTVNPPRPIKMQARVTDRAGNTGYSAERLVSIVAVPAAERWQTTAVAADYDPLAGDSLAQQGNVQIVHFLDLDQSPGCGCNMPFLIYNSNSVTVQPIVQASIQSDNGVALPATLTATLTWDLDRMMPPTYSNTLNTTGRSPGELLTIGVQVTTAVAATGRYRWRLDVVTPDSVIPKTVTGAAFVVVNDSSPFGAGWTFSATDRLVSLPTQGPEPAGVLRLFGTGGARFYRDLGGGTFQSPAEDPGTLTLTGGTYTYATPDNSKWVFNSAGYQTGWVSGCGCSRITFTYDGSNRLRTMTSTDFGVGTFTYDMSGTPVTIEAPGSRVTTLALDTITPRNLVTITDPENGVRTFTYAPAENHRITGESFAGISRSWTYQYGAASTLTQGSTGGSNPSYTTTTVVAAAVQGLAALVAGAVEATLADRTGRTTRTTLDSRGRALQTTLPDGGQWQFTRNSGGFVTASTDPLGRTVTMTRDAQQYVTLETLPDTPASTRSYVYSPTDGFHSLLSATDERGKTTTYTYYDDGTGHLKTAVNALNQTTTYTWITTGIKAGLLETITDPLLRVTRYLYDSSRRLEEIIQAEGTADQVRTTMIYDAAGNVLSQTTGIVSGPSTLAEHKVTTSFTYDKLNRRTAVLEAFGTSWQRTTTTVYDAVGNVTRILDALNRTTSFGYDTAGRQTTVIEAYGTAEQRSRQTVYDDAGNVSRQIDPLGRETRYAYDGVNRLIEVTEAWGRAEARTTTTLYDLAGNVSSTIDPLGRETRFSYDARDRQVTVTEAFDTSLARTTTTVYDPASNVLSVTNPRNYTTSYAYDNLNRQTQRIEAFGVSGLQRTSTTAYDLAGNVLSLTDPLNRTTSFVYDNLNRRTRTIEALNLPEQRTGTVVYDSAGNVLRSIDPRNVTTSIAYDKLNRQTTVVEAFGTAEQRTATFLYDAVSNLLSVTTGQSADTSYQQPVTTSYAYDALNRQTQVIEAFGVSGQQRTTTTLYDAVSNVLRVTDALGRRREYAYDALDRTLNVTEAVATAVQRTSFTAYDPVSNVTRSTDPLGQATVFRYDSLDRQTEVVEAFGTTVERTSTAVYDANNNVTRTIDALGRTTSHAYDALDRRTQTDEAFGTSVQRSATFLYDAADNLLSVTTGQATNNPHVVTTSFGYDNLDRRTSLIEAFGITGQQRTSTMLYDAGDNLLSQTQPQTYDNAATPVRTTTSYAYDALNRRTCVLDAYGDTLQHTTTTVYDAADNVLRVEAPLSRTTSIAYDKLNRRTTLVEAWNTPEQRTATYLYDAVDNLVSMTTGQSTVTTYAHVVTTSYAYDALNRQTARIDAFGVGGQQRTTTTVYDLADNVVATVDARGNAWTVTYDALNRAVSRTDPLNHTTTTVYDAVDNVIRTHDALDYKTTFTYDALNRRVTTQDPGTGVFTNVYDAANNVINTIDQVNQQTTFTYDKLNRQTKVTDARNGVTTLVYDAADNLTRLIDSVGNGTTFVYDKLSRLTQQTDPLNKNTTFAYDAADRRTSSTDRLGRVRNFTYDALDRTQTETWVAGAGSPANLRTFTYDAASNLRSAANNAGTFTYGYDKLNRRTTEQQPFGLNLTYTYDANDNRTKVEDSLSGVTTSVYDAANRLTRREFGGSGQTPLRIDLTYTDRDQLESLTRYSNLAGTQKVGSTLYHYDAARRLDNLKHRDASDVVFWNTTYGYDLAHRLTSEQYNGGTAVNFGYDLTNQLTSASGGRSENYGHDLNGNRTTANGVSYGTPAAGNRLTTVGSWTFTYNDEGSIIQKSLGAGAETWTYLYDHDNQLILVEKRATPGGTLLLRAEYTYDAFNRRLQKAVDPDGDGMQGTTTTRFAYDGIEIWADLDVSNALTSRYLHGDTVDELYARIGVSGMTQTAYWYLTDRQGSVRQLRTSAGSLVNQIDYDSFGNVTYESNPGLNERIKFTGRERDSESGLQYNRKRYYDPWTSRWTSEDPIGFRANDPNLHRYVGNSPTNATDPNGELLLAQDGAQGAWARWLASKNIYTMEVRLSSGKWYIHIYHNQRQKLVKILEESGEQPALLRTLTSTDPRDAGWHVLGSKDLSTEWIRIKLSSDDWAEIRDIVAHYNRVGFNPSVSYNPDRKDYVKEFCKGLQEGNRETASGFKEGAIDAVKGIGHVITDPVGTAEGVGRAVEQLAKDPVGTAKAVGNSIVESAKENPSKFCGKVAFESLATATGAKAAELVKDAKVIGTVGKASKGMGKLTGEFSAAERQMIQRAEQALRGAGYDTSLMKEVILADFPKGTRGMTIGSDAAAVSKEAFKSQAMLNHVLEEELRHLQQKAAGLAKEFGPGTAQRLEEAAGAARKFPEPKQ